MRLAAVLGCALILSVPAFAATKTDASPPHNRFVVYGKTVAAVPMAEWQDADGKLHVATGKGQVAKAPAKAAKYSVKSVAWPSGTVRVLTFGKGGVFHNLWDETEIYVLKGSITVNVGGSSAVLHAGDVVARASGIVRSGDKPEETVLVTWTVGTLNNEPGKPTVVRAADAPEAGQPGVLKVKRYEFPGNSIRVASLAKGSKNGPASAKTDSLIYIKSGKLRFFEGDEVHEVVAGDFLFEEAGQTHRWEHLEESSFVTTSGIPRNAGTINPAEAVDRPEKK
jgi:quercetin dioxygenase-like cupin family protein